MEKLIYNTAPIVTFATNRFINIPIILQYDETPLISIVEKEQLGFTTEIPIFHPDGTYLAKVNGTRVYPTKDGKKAGIEMRSLPDATVCKMGGKTLFEIYHERGNSFRTNAELYTPTGYFVKFVDSPTPEIVSRDGQPLQFRGAVMSQNTLIGCQIGIWLKSDGSCALGCNRNVQQLSHAM
ncbi:MAG: hypothetical protein ACR2P1_13170 [Pseudomonadales bacterium]